MGEKRVVAGAKNAPKRWSKTSRKDSFLSRKGDVHCLCIVFFVIFVVSMHVDRVARKSVWTMCLLKKKIAIWIKIGLLV